LSFFRRPSGRALRTAAALAAILALAAVLRFAGQPFGLRHTPHWDERAFIEPVGKMRANGDLDHRFYEYPGLFVYLLHAWLAPLPLEVPPGPSWYLGGRRLVGVFGVLSVALVFFLGRKLAGTAAGLTAALFTAVSPVEVRTAHMIRPDVALETFVLLAFLAFERIGTRWRDDLVAGVALGAAAAVKWTGVFLAPSYLVYRFLRPGPRYGRIAAVAGVSLVVLLAATPYALIHREQFLAGVRVQLDAHYDAPIETPPGYLQLVRYYVGILTGDLGPAGTVLLVAGLVLAGRRWRIWAPVLLFIGVTIAVLSTAELRWSRLIVPSFGLVALLPGLAVETLAARRPALAAAIALVAGLYPLAPFTNPADGTFLYVRTLTRPGTWDRAVDWVAEHAPPGARVLSSVRELGFDRTRLEVLAAVGPPDMDRLLARNCDFVVTSVGGPSLDASVVEGLTLVFTARDARAEAGPEMSVYAVPDSARPRYAPVPLEAAWLKASVNAAALPALVDGQTDTYWATTGPQQSAEWIELDLPAAVELGRVELALGRRPFRYGSKLHLLVSDDGVEWRRLRVVPGRPPIEEQARPLKEASQVLLPEPARARKIRIEQTGKSDRVWSIAELRVSAIDGAAKDARR
jgi:4-amino-4-deoxy-L-arabinose transferase-like glycosyltransferase